MRDKQWLETQYAAGHSLYEMAAQAGVHATTIGRWMDHYGLPRRSHAEGTRRRVQRCREDPTYQDYRAYQNPDWLRQQYEDKGRSADEIARLAGVTASTIYRWLKRHGIAQDRASEIRAQALFRIQGPFPYHDPHWLRWQYEDCHRTLAEIGELCGVQGQTIRKWMRRFGIPRRRSSHHNRSLRRVYSGV